jgi:DNA-binding MarR family transcriptional regulator
VNPTACELYRLLAELASVLSREEARMAQELGLSEGELQCLCAMRGSLQYSIKELTDILHKGGSQLSRILDTLEDKGMIARSLSRKDRRYVHVILTTEGTALAQRIEEWESKVFERIVDLVPPEKIEDVKKFVRIFLEMNQQGDLIQNESRSLT